MGCWDITCAVSHLPILKGDPIRLLLLRQQADQDPSPFHPWAIWSPVSLPFKGKYDNYGGICEVESNAVVNFQVERLARRARVSSEASPINAAQFVGPLDLESLLRCCERGLLELSYLHKKLKVAPMFVHEQVWKDLVCRNFPIGTQDWRVVLENDRRNIETDRLRQWLGLDSAFRQTFLDLVSFGCSREEGFPDIWVLEEGEAFDFLSLETFTDHDWETLRNLELELRTFYLTLTRDLRTPLFPCVISDQFYRQDLLNPQKIFAHHLLKWAVSFEKKMRVDFGWDEEELEEHHG
jgi:hypothetical protein